MRMPLRLAPALLMTGALHGQVSPPPNAQLAALLQDALAGNPQLKASRASLEAERTLVPQAGALPDPMVTLGYQNNGFGNLTYGTSPQSFAKVEVSQSFPYPGKRTLREQIAESGVAVADAAVDRVRLDLIADVKRAYFDLLRVRGQRTLLDAQTALWSQVSKAAQARMEAGMGSTADLLRAQLEQTRLIQQEAALEGRTIALVAELNRLAARPPGSPIGLEDHLEGLPLPSSADVEGAVGQAVTASPELQEARHHQTHFQQQVELSKLDLRPDFTVSAGVMPQGPMSGMWNVSVGFNVPLWSGRKQQQALAGARAQVEMQGDRVADMEQRLGALTRARVARFDADVKVVSLYQQGLLAQSDAAYQAALSQFASGSAPFRQVLEALSDRLKDRSDYLDALAQVHFDAIELERVAPADAVNGNAMNGGGQ